MNRFNTQLPQIQPSLPPKTNWLSRHHLWGYGFLTLAFLLAVAFIYQLEYSKKQNAQICIQVVIAARNSQTGQVKNFPTPCDVPSGWEKIENSNLENTNKFQMYQ